MSTGTVMTATRDEPEQQEVRPSRPARGWIPVCPCWV